MTKLLKVLAILLSVAAIVGGTVAATVAYLTAKTNPVQNTFTAGDIDITLAQKNTLTDEKMVPGKTYTIDPVVTVLNGSEKCYLFVKVDLTESFDTYLQYTMADGWTEMTVTTADKDGDEITEKTGVFYRVVEATTADTKFGIIKADKITAKADTTKFEYNKITAGTVDKPNMTLTAYAVQFEGVGDAEATEQANAAAAWEIAKNLDSQLQQ